MLSSPRLTYSIPVPEDFDRYYEIYSVSRTNFFNPKGPMSAADAPDAFNQFITHFQDHRFGIWTIREKNADAIIGFGGLSYRMYGDEVKLNLGYRFAETAWRKGYATEMSMFSID